MKQMNQEEKVKYMTTTPVGRLVLSLATPTIISMLVTSFYNMADTFFVGKIDTQSTAAVGVVFSIMAIIQAVGFFFGHGSGNYISRKLGAKEFEAARKMASTGFFTAFMFGSLITVVGLLIVKPLAIFLGATSTILPYAVSYLKIILIGAPFIASSFVLNNQLRFQGSAAFGMVGIVSGAVINIGLDPLFIFVFDMGVAGAAAATVISQVISFAILLVGCSKGSNIKITIKNYTPTLDNFYQIFRGGIPSLLRQGLASVATILLNQVAGSYSDAAIAGLSIVTRIAMGANSALIGFGQGFQPVCGFNYGAKLYRRVREGFYFCVKYATIFLLIVSTVIIIFAPEIVGWFRKGDPEVIRVGTTVLRLQCLTFPLNAWVTITNMMLQSIGKAFKASVVSSARQGWAFIPLILILPACFGLFGVEITQTLADLITFVVALPLSLSVLKLMKEDKQ